MRAVADITDTAVLRSLYTTMLRMRRFEEKVQELFRAGEMPGFVHLYIGEEAVGAGVCQALRAEDLIFSTHRGHGHAIAKGVPARDVMAELYGKATGSCGGRGGSMHLYAPEHGFMGTNGIVAGGIPLATGAALSAKLRKTGQVVICFFGDGATNAGSFHESLNFGAVWDLPVVYVCENNLYATEMALSRATKCTDLAARAASYRMPGMTVDGNDVAAVLEAAQAAVERARTGAGPTLLECRTYRFVGHHEGDPGTNYRTKDEIEAWKRRCPLRVSRAMLEGDLSPAEFDAIEAEVSAWLDDAVQFARTSPLPSPSTAADHVWC